MVAMTTKGLLATGKRAEGFQLSLACEDQEGWKNVSFFVFFGRESRTSEMLS